MDTRELLNERFGEMYSLIQQGRAQDADDLLTQLALEIEEMK